MVYEVKTKHTFKRYRDSVDIYPNLEDAIAYLTAWIREKQGNGNSLHVIAEHIRWVMLDPEARQLRYVPYYTKDVGDDAIYLRQMAAFKPINDIK